MGRVPLARNSPPRPVTKCSQCAGKCMLFRANCTLQVSVMKCHLEVPLLLRCFLQLESLQHLYQILLMFGVTLWATFVYVRWVRCTNKIGTQTTFCLLSKQFSGEEAIDSHVNLESQWPPPFLLEMKMWEEGGEEHLNFDSLFGDVLFLIHLALSSLSSS